MTVCVWLSMCITVLFCSITAPIVAFEVMISTVTAAHKALRKLRDEFTDENR